jgi:hypothetical protein
MDANRSFQIVVTGNHRYKLRPVIFVNVYADDLVLPSKMVRVFGVVKTVTEPGTGQSALICYLHFAAQLGAHSTSDPDDCVRIFTNESTSIFGEDGLATNFQSIAPEDAMTAIGVLT